MQRREDGQGGIRTHDTRKGIPVFETGSFSHSDTCPAGGKDKRSTGKKKRERSFGLLRSRLYLLLSYWSSAVSPPELRERARSTILMNSPR